MAITVENAVEVDGVYCHVLDMRLRIQFVSDDSVDNEGGDVVELRYSRTEALQ